MAFNVSKKTSEHPWGHEYEKPFSDRTFWMFTFFLLNTSGSQSEMEAALVVAVALIMSLEETV